MNHRPLTMAFSLAILVGTVVLFMLVPKGFIPSQDIGQIFVDDRNGAGHVVRRHGRAPEAGRRDPAAPTRTSPGFYSAVGGSSTVSGTNQGRLLIGLKPRDERVERRRDDQGAAAEARQGAGHRRLHAESAADSDRRARVEEPVSVHDAELGHRDAVSGGRRSSSRRRASRRSLQDVTSDLQLGNPQASVEIDRERAASLGVTAKQIETRAVQRVRLAPGLDDLHAEQRVLGRDGAPAAVPARSVGAEPAVRPLEHRRARAAQRRRAHHADARARSA